MAIFSIPRINLSGWSAAVPKNKVSNWEYTPLTPSERKLLVKTTGVEERRMAPKGMTTSDLCFVAAEQLLQELSWDKKDIQLVVFLSQSRDYYLPATAVILQDRLGLPKSCLAFDVGLGCSGYVYGLSIIGSLMATSGIKKGLLMVGDISTASCAYEDKSTYPLFGDAGTVTAMEYNEQAEPMHYNLNSDGSGYKAIMIPDGGVRNRVTEQSFEQKEYEGGIRRSNIDLALSGLDVFNFSVTAVPPSIYDLMAYLNSTTQDYDYFLMHQANKLMNETIRKKMTFAIDQVPYSIQQFGNTSSASIPLTMVTKLREELSTKPLSLLLSGFGVGLSWGVVSLSTRPGVCCKLIEV
jgi:3-oxoacyl-[acyl-carrier-protein] synthase-3